MRGRVATVAIAVVVPIVGTAMLPLLAVGSGAALPPVEPPAWVHGEIPSRVLEAYLASDRACTGLRWQLLAGIGWVESRHGTTGGATADAGTGEVAPAILGPPLDGSHGRRALPVGPWSGQWGLAGPWQQALGPMQFLPGTFAAVAVDRDDDGDLNPHDVDDAVASAAAYLCNGNDDLGAERAALLRYNASGRYADDVLAYADRLSAGSALLCPVAGPVSFTDTWLAPRSGGRRHQGVDMFARLGTPVAAPVAGVVELGSNSLGGLVFHLWGDDGTYYYGAHLSRHGAASGAVAAGAVLGYVGTSGNAAGTPPHLHFEIHPGRRPSDPPGAVNPTPAVADACALNRAGVVIGGGD